jgi:hypothetical protein
VESRTALPGKRNQFIVQIVPALYEVVDEPVIVWFSLTFYDLNRAFFKDGRAQHEAETRAMLKNYRPSYRAKLSAGEQAVYEILDERGQAAFRICRDLAKRGKENVFFCHATIWLHGSSASPGKLIAFCVHSTATV